MVKIEVDGKSYNLLTDIEMFDITDRLVRIEGILEAIKPIEGEPITSDNLISALSNLKNLSTQMQDLKKELEDARDEIEDKCDDSQVDDLIDSALDEVRLIRR